MNRKQIGKIEFFKTDLKLAIFRAEQGHLVFPVPSDGLGVAEYECKHIDLHSRDQSGVMEAFAIGSDMYVGMYSGPGSSFVAVSLVGKRGKSSWNKLMSIHGCAHKTRTERFGTKSILYFKHKGGPCQNERWAFGKQFPGIWIYGCGRHLVDDRAHQFLNHYKSTTSDPILQAPNCIQIRLINQKKRFPLKYRKIEKTKHEYF